VPSALAHTRVDLFTTPTREHAKVWEAEGGS
jgi:hypothetical protein